MARPSGPRRFAIVHLFPDLLRAYGDGGNVQTLVRRATERGFPTDVVEVGVGARRIPDADLVLVGGGQDREQVTVARELERLGDGLRDQVGRGTALLAVCGGYQNLGRAYRTSAGDLFCPGLLGIRTDATIVGPRLVGPVLAEVGGPPPELPERSLIGFENHGGRTFLEPGAPPLAAVEIGHGNNGSDGTEGFLGLPGTDGLGGLRIGTYLHGPLLPRNPHLADLLLAAALGRGPAIELAPLDDALEWGAHRRARSRLRRAERNRRRVPGWVHRVADPVRDLVGF